MVIALRINAVGPCVSLPWAGEIVPSAKVSPANRPSGVAPVKAPPGAWAVMDIPVGLVDPPQAVGNVIAVSAQNL